MRLREHSSSKTRMTFRAPHPEIRGDAFSGKNKLANHLLGQIFHFVDFLKSRVQGSQPAL